MEITASENLLLAFLTSCPWLSTILDWLIKSALIICITYLIVQLLSNKLSSGSKHLLWLNSLACAMLVPLFISLSVLLEAPTPFATQLLSIQVVPSTTYVASTSVDSIPWMSGAVVLLYLLPVMALLLKLTTSIANVFRINRTAEPALDLADLNRLVQLQGQQRIARPVALKYSGQVISPLSFGLFKPTIILPEQARCWDRNITDDVLIHELSHIKRLDWLTMFVSYVIASVLWISPLSWLALRKLNEEAENSCDGTVLRLKEEETSYAETLLSIAHDMKGDSAPEMFAQLMLDNNTLSMRIHRILENNMASATTHRLFAIPLAALALIILATCTSAQLMTTESASRPSPEANGDGRGEILPIVAVAPQYPTRAAFAGIEGWALVEFTVLTNGDVEEDSVEVVDADPVTVFDRSVVRTAKKFKFAPIAGSNPQEIPGVQYLFRFRLTNEEGQSDGINRDLEPTNSVTPVFPDQARPDNIEGASVWTVFHVTREGTVQDVIINYSSNDLFNEAAIAAAQQLQFQPRDENGPVPGNVGGDTTGLVRAQYLFSFQ